MAGYGIPEADIGCVLEIDPKTLRRHYRKELDKGHIKASAKVAENLYRKAATYGSQSRHRCHLLAEDESRLERDLPA